MLCLEVAVNGERHCLAGVGEVGALSAFVTWVGTPPWEGAPAVSGPTYLSVTGFSGFTDDQRHLHWGDVTFPLRVGDVVTVKVVEATEPDPGQPSLPPAQQLKVKPRSAPDHQSSL